MNARSARAAGALGMLLVLVVGTPLALLALVGNPWPGRTRLELGDDVALLVGVLAVLAWIVWARFVAAIGTEVRVQLAERERLAAITPDSAERIRFVPPPERAGAGRVAQQLVAAVLVLLPVAARVAPVMASSPPLGPSLRPTAVSVAVGAPAASPVAPAPGPAPAPLGAGAPRSVTVAPGDTLIGIARSNLGDAERWREIFETNRETVQPDGGRLTSPSLIRAGWTLVLPADASAPAVAPATGTPPAPVPASAGYLVGDVVTVEAGDSLWELARARLAEAGLPHDQLAVGDYVHEVVAGNPGVIEDPDLIFVGERFSFPAVGTPPLPPQPPPPMADVPPAVPDPSPALPAATFVDPVAPAPAPPGPDPAPAAAGTVAPPGTTTTTTVPPVADPGPTQPTVDAAPASSPSPIGLGEAALLSAGVVALLASRRRLRLRGAPPRARVPEPHPDAVDAERRLRSVDASERLLRVDVAVRAAAASLLHGRSGIAVIRAGTDGGIELTLTASGTLPPPWEGDGTCWRLPGSTPIELLAEAARTVGAPCVALAEIGVDREGREVLADLEALGLLAVEAPADVADAVVRGLAATLASSVFAEVAHLIGAGIDERTFLEHRLAHSSPTVDGALELAATLVGATSTARQSTFVLRARHTSGEAWEPAVVFVGSALVEEMTPDVARSAMRVGGGLAVVAGGAVPGAPWTLRVDGSRWVLDPLGIELVPVGLTAPEVDALHAVVAAVDAPLVEEEPTPLVDAVAEPTEPVTDDWTLLVRLLGPVEIVDTDGRSAVFERSKALELVAWLTMHRERATRAGARTALWELDVRDATFANVVSEARRAMARLVEPPEGREWLGRTLTEVLPLHDGVAADVDVIRHRLDVARLQPPELAIETLRPAVELVRDAPFVGTGYLWPDAEGITSNLVLLATSAAAELAGHFLSMGDIEGVFWATDRGLRVLPGHEELIALRMRAHARAGDLAGVRHEWETYERVLNADPWSDGEPAAKLVLLRRELLSS